MYLFCKDCNSDKNLEEMVSSSKYGAGYKSLCKQCDRIRAKSYRQKNKFKISISRKIAYQNNRSQNLAIKKEYYAKNKQQLIVKHKSYYSENKSSVKAQQNKRNKERIAEDPAFALRKRISRRIRRFLTSDMKNIRTVEIVGMSWENLVDYFVSIQSIDIRQDRVLTYLEVDHICPMSQAKNAEEIIKLNNFKNLQLLTKTLNGKKSNNATPEAVSKCLELLGRNWE